MLLSKLRSGSHRQDHTAKRAKSGAPVDDDADIPDDANSCTIDICSPDGGPEHTPQDPGSACDGGYCHTDLSCQACPERDTCEDTTSEPNQTQSKAFELPQVSDGASIVYQCETLGTSDDVDWFRFDTVDSVLGKVAPNVVLDPADLEVCAYFQCKNAGTKIVCPEGTTAHNAPLGQQGCCGHGRLRALPRLQGHRRGRKRVAHGPPRPGAAMDSPSCINYQLGFEY